MKHNFLKIFQDLLTNSNGNLFFLFKLEREMKYIKDNLSRFPESEAPNFLYFNQENECSYWKQQREHSDTIQTTIELLKSLLIS